MAYIYRERTDLAEHETVGQDSQTVEIFHLVSKSPH